MSIFADVRFLIKRLHISIALDRNIWDNIAIVVALNSLHNDFSTTTKSILKRGDKIINKIQQILAFTEVKFISKHITGSTEDLAMMSKSRNLTKRKASSKDKYFNYRKLGHWRRDCTLPDYQKQKKNKNKSTTSPSNRQPRHRNRTNIAAITINKVDSDPKLYRPGKADMVKVMTSSQ